MNMYSLLFAFCLVVESSAVFGQFKDGAPIKCGVSANILFNGDRAEFSELPGFPTCCQKFNSGFGFGIDAGVLAEIPFSRQFSLRGRFSIISKNVEFISDEKIDVLVDGAPVNGQIRHYLDARSAMISFEPTIVYNPVERFNISTGIGFGLRYAGNFNQKEVLIEPQIGVFADTRKRSRNEMTAKIPDLNACQFSVAFAISRDFSLNRDNTVLISPEVGIHYALNNVAGGVSLWKAHSARLGIAFKYVFNQCLPDEIIQPNDVAEKNENNTLNNDKSYMRIENNNARSDAYDSSKITRKYPQLIVEAFSKHGALEQMPIIRIEQYASKQMIPLLNYIFFDDNSDSIPKRYRTITAGEATKYDDIDKLSGNDVAHTYYDLLNIIGRRMSARPTSNIVLIGCNSDVRNEIGNTELSGKRAEAIAKYLMEIWGVKNDRITIKRRNKPEKYTNGASKEAEAENRRVEIQSDNMEILAPVIHTDILYSSATSKIKATATAADNAAKIEADSVVEVIVNGKTRRVIRFNAGIAEWDTGSEAEELLRDVACEKEIELALNKYDKKQNTHCFVPVEVENMSNMQSLAKASKEIDHYRLILFDYDKAEISPENQKTLSFIKENIKKGDKIIIKGYADILGDENYNKLLSENRAKAVAGQLNSEGAVIVGNGMANLFDNTLPEGRFYSRTAHVIVEKQK